METKEENQQQSGLTMNPNTIKTAPELGSDALLAEIEEWESACDDLNEKGGKLLRKAGWQYHCDTPDHSYVWYRELEGRSGYMTRSIADALRIEKFIQANATILPAKSNDPES